MLSVGRETVSCMLLVGRETVNCMLSGGRETVNYHVISEKGDGVLACYHWDSPDIILCG